MPKFFKRVVISALQVQMFFRYMKLQKMEVQLIRNIKMVERLVLKAPSMAIVAVCIAQNDVFAERLRKVREEMTLASMNSEMLLEKWFEFNPVLAWNFNPKDLICSINVDAIFEQACAELEKHFDNGGDHRDFDINFNCKMPKV